MHNVVCNVRSTLIGATHQLRSCGHFIVCGRSIHGE